MDTQPKFYDKAAAAKFLGIGEFHTGQLIRDKKVVCEKVAVLNKTTGLPTKTMKWMVTEASLIAYKANRKSFGGGSNPNGVRKNFIYATPDQIKAIQALYPEIRIGIANPTKAGKIEDETETE